MKDAIPHLNEALRSYGAEKIALAELVKTNRLSPEIYVLCADKLDELIADCNKMIKKLEKSK